MIAELADFWEVNRELRTIKNMQPESPLKGMAHLFAFEGYGIKYVEEINNERRERRATIVEDDGLEDSDRNRNIKHPAITVGIFFYNLVYGEIRECHVSQELYRRPELGVHGMIRDFTMLIDKIMFGQRASADSERMIMYSCESFDPLRSIMNFYFPRYFDTFDRTRYVLDIIGNSSLDLHYLTQIAHHALANKEQFSVMLKDSERAGTVAVFQVTPEHNKQEFKELLKRFSDSLVNLAKTEVVDISYISKLENAFASYLNCLNYLKNRDSNFAFLDREIKKVQETARKTISDFPSRIVDVGGKTWQEAVAERQRQIGETMTIGQEQQEQTEQRRVTVRRRNR